MGGGVIKANRLVGTQGVQTKAASPGCIYKMTSICVFLLITKMPSGVKCKHPQRVVMHPSRKSYTTSATSTPSKYSSQSEENCPKRNLIESTKEDSKYPKGKEAEWGCRPILAQRLIRGRGPLEWIQMLWKTSARNGVIKETG